MLSIQLRVLFACLVVAVPVGTKADDSTAVQQPSFRVGDSWTYNKIDLWKNEFQFSVVSTITALTNKQIILEAEGLDGSGHSTVFRTPDFNVARIESGNKVQISDPFYPNYAFPLQVGKTWERGVTFRSSDSSKEVQASLKGRVVGWELITVPAGTFRALRIDLEGTYRGISVEGRWNGEIRDRLWFAPEVRNAVKYEYEDTASGSRYTSERYELLRYRLMP